LKKNQPRRKQKKLYKKLGKKAFYLHNKTKNKHVKIGMKNTKEQKEASIFPFPKTKSSQIRRIWERLELTFLEKEISFSKWGDPFCELRNYFGGFPCYY